MTYWNSKKDEIARSIQFCKDGHNSIKQVRKYTGEAYYHHPMEVMDLVIDNMANVTLEVLQAALFHDLVEDTPITLEDITREFGPKVAELVEMLTDKSNPSDGNRKQRKAIDLHHTSQANYEAKTIKLCDLISNTRSIVKYDKDFAKVYLKEKEKLMKVLGDSDPTVYALAYATLQEAQMELMRESIKDL